MEIKVTTTQLTVTSAIPAELYAQAMDFNPNALVVKDEHGSEVYKASFNEKLGSASVGQYGAVFSAVNEQGYLEATITFAKQYSSKEKAVAAVKKDLGNGLASLAEAEPIIMAQIAAATNRVAAVFAGV